MPKRQLEALGDLQRAAIEIVWQKGGATVNEVRDELARKGPLAYTTVLSVMQKLEKRGWLRHRRRGRQYLYEPTRSRDQAGAHSLRHFIRQVFGGNRLLLFESLLREEDLTADELAELRRRIDEREKEMRHE